MANIRVVDGSISRIEQTDGFNPNKTRIIAHCVNCQAKMGANAALHLKNRYATLEQSYIAYCNQFTKSDRKQLLGRVFEVQVAPRTFVFNLFGHFYYGRDKRFVNYESLFVALEKMAELIEFRKTDVDIYIPFMMASSKGSGDWGVVSAMIQATLGRLSCNIFIVKYKASER